VFGCIRFYTDFLLPPAPKSLPPLWSGTAGKTSLGPEEDFGSSMKCSRPVQPPFQGSGGADWKAGAGSRIVCHVQAVFSTPPAAAHER